MCFCWPGAEGSMPTAPWNSFVESPSTITWFFLQDFLPFHVTFLPLEPLGLSQCCGGQWLPPPQPRGGQAGAGGAAPALAMRHLHSSPSHLAASSEVRAKAAQQGRTKPGVGLQRAEHLGKEEIAVQTSGSSAGEGFELPPRHLPLKLACDNAYYWNWVQFRRWKLVKMKYDEQTYPMVIFSHPGTSTI